MPDTYTLRLQNFRSLQDVTYDIAPLTVVYGPNGSGKSSLIYGLLTLKNFLTNSNQNLPSFFSYPSISLGGWDEVVHRHRVDQSLSLSMRVSGSQPFPSEFTLALSQSGGEASLTFNTLAGEISGVWPNKLSIPIAIPYQGNQLVQDHFDVTFTGKATGTSSEASPIPLSGELMWNGIVAFAQCVFGSEHTELTNLLNKMANSPLELARQVGFVPLRRGFSKAVYGLTAVTSALASDDEVASSLVSPTERFRLYDLNKGYFEKVTDRRVQANALVGTSSFTIDSIPLVGQGSPVSIVNEGFGINQLLYMLTVCLHPQFKIVAIEEPEIHLHPAMVRKLAPVLAEIASKENRRLIVSTHSEAFVVALLSQIAAGAISVDDVSFILAENPNGETRLTRCEATPDGQIEGGLAPFMTAELEDLAAFLGLNAQEG